MHVDEDVQKSSQSGIALHIQKLGNAQLLMLRYLGILVCIHLCQSNHDRIPSNLC
ncbi:hypothetical protein GGD68_002404 [Paraburkholderia fungorum]|jgi:hypothetical protein|uniref:Uncharacterized protein n=1 Tax=Paraburkholderia fungorum TaxID=134537 RepID=A0AAW3UQG7_9BURK|nr:hypothetical protein [Paraburkholderia fungorum]MBB6200884.1 hypothetical protein [Paraburkholderia fungorum]